MDVLEWVCCVDNDKLLLCYMHDVKNQLHIHSLSNGVRVKTLPLDIGSVTAFSGDKKFSEVGPSGLLLGISHIVRYTYYFYFQIFYSFKSFLTPGLIYRYDFSDEEPSPTVNITVLL